MKSFLKFIYFFMKLPKYLFQILIFFKSDTNKFKYLRLSPKLFDNKKKEPFDAHYLYHTAWATRVLNKIKPDIHYDFCSDLRFVTIASAYCNIVQYNLNTPTIKLPNLSFRKTNLIDMKNIEDNSLNSISCMHVIEHVGLGRYGDPINFKGDILAINEIKRVLANDGNLLFVTPLGKKKIYFNAHRVYTYEEIINYFSNYKLKEFSLIEDDGFNEGIILNADPSKVKNNKYACGCFWFEKKIGSI